MSYIREHTEYIQHNSTNKKDRKSQLNKNDAFTAEVTKRPF